MVIYNKAIRDKIPEIIKNSGDSSVIKNLSDEKFLAELEKKLKEEVEEYLESKSVEELADIIEVINRISELKGISHHELEKIRQKKSYTSNSYTKRISARQMFLL